MTTPAPNGGVSLPDRRNPKKHDAVGGGFLAKISQSTVAAKGNQYASDSIFVTQKLWAHTAKAAWIFSTSFLILVVPLIVQTERDQQLAELELQQANILGFK